MMEAENKGAAVPHAQGSKADRAAQANGAASTLDPRQDRAARLAEIRLVDATPEKLYGAQCKLTPAERSLREAITIIDEMQTDHELADGCLDMVRERLVYFLGAERMDGVPAMNYDDAIASAVRESATAKLGAELRKHWPVVRELLERQAKHWESYSDTNPEAAKEAGPARAALNALTQLVV